jgi:hypothetical protein
MALAARWPQFLKARRLRFLLLVLYYFAIIAVLIFLYSLNRFSTPPFVYQGF